MNTTFISYLTLTAEEGEHFPGAGVDKDKQNPIQRLVWRFRKYAAI